MESLEITGKTVEEAITDALEKLGVEREEVEVDVISKGRQGILGLGSEPAVVRVSLKKTSVAPTAQRLLEDILSRMGVKATLHQRETQAGGQPSDEQPVVFDVEGEDSSLLIGRRGETLGALQFLVNSILSRKSEKRIRVALDVEGYKARRQEALKNLALELAERVATSGRSLSLEPMPAAERRLVHMALANHARVATQSVGGGEDRKVMIVPKRRQGRDEARFPGGRPYSPGPEGQ